MKKLVVFSLVLGVLGASCGRPSPGAVLDSGWEKDARFLVEELARIHPNPWRKVPRQTVLATALRAAEPGLEFGVRVARLTSALALVHEGHTLPSWRNPVQRLPFQLELFADGLRVVVVQDGAWQTDGFAPAELSGAALRSVGGQDVVRLTARLGAYASAENQVAVLAAVPRMAVDAGILADLGLVDADGWVRLGFESVSGRRLEARARPSTGDPLAVTGRPLALRQAHVPLWTQTLSGGKAAYLAYNRCSGDYPFDDVTAQFLELSRRPEVSAILVDLRFNSGGNSAPFSNRVLPELRSLAQTKTLVVLAGVNTFSSAIIALIELREAGAVFVGEATSEGANSYGEIKEVKLPFSGYRFITSTKYFEFLPGVPEGLPIEPDRPVVAAFADFDAGRDPVLAAGLAEAGL